MSTSATNLNTDQSNVPYYASNDNNNNDVGDANDTTGTIPQETNKKNKQFGCCEAICCLGAGCILAEICFPDESPCCKAFCYPLCCCFLPFFIFPDKSVKS